MEQAGLTHHDCVALIGDRARRVTATISVDGGDPVPLAAYACPGGDLLVPTGTDPSLPRSAVSKPVTVEFTGPAGADEHWTFSGTGLAQPLTHHDRPHDDHPQAMLYAFDNGIRVLMARLSAVRTEAATLPQQRTAGTPRHRPHSHRLTASRRQPLRGHPARSGHGPATVAPTPLRVTDVTAERSRKNPGGSQADVSAGEPPGSSGDR
ncbi:hypothetical protein [Prauserella alba]|uniref:Uncharacterized protein n=1 Tax=Prauserella alba TaxID=176898 RepID=A0ABN1VH54_9PSEU|nr:hypothetical protein [Prauserella alba]MCP2183057.1 hypothetical protein [Prauserella alba]